MVQVYKNEVYDVLESARSGLSPKRKLRIIATDQEAATCRRLEMQAEGAKTVCSHANNDSQSFSLSVLTDAVGAVEDGNRYRGCFTT